MLAKENRLKKKKDFERVFKKGKVLKERFIILKFIENNLKKSRFAFIVSQKISKKAVERNKIKRLMSEGLRDKIKDLTKKIDGIFIALPGIENEKFWGIKKVIENILKKVKHD